MNYHYFYYYYDSVSELLSLGYNDFQTEHKKNRLDNEKKTRNFNEHS